MELSKVEACEAVRGKPSRTKAVEEELSSSLALTRSVTSESGTRSPRSTAAAT